MFCSTALVFKYLPFTSICSSCSGAAWAMDYLIFIFCRVLHLKRFILYPIAKIVGYSIEYSWLAEFECQEFCMSRSTLLFLLAGNPNSRYDLYISFLCRISCIYCFFLLSGYYFVYTASDWASVGCSGFSFFSGMVTHTHLHSP